MQGGTLFRFSRKGKKGELPPFFWLHVSLVDSEESITRRQIHCVIASTSMSECKLEIDISTANSV